jgi:putative NADH-flavin reductase
MPERIVIFGASGRTGIHLVRQALTRGMQVTGCVRDLSKLPIQDDCLEVVQGDMLDSASIDQAMSGGGDAVVLALGAYQREYKTDLSRGTVNIMNSMRHHHVRRLLVISSIGVGDSAGQGTFMVRLFQRYMLKYVLWDKSHQESAVRDSGLDWTIIRPPRLFGQDGINHQVTVWSGPSPAVKLTWSVTRATLAHFVLEALATKRYIGEAINISDARP